MPVVSRSVIAESFLARGLQSQMRRTKLEGLEAHKPVGRVLHYWVSYIRWAARRIHFFNSVLTESKLDAQNQKVIELCGASRLLAFLQLAHPSELPARAGPPCVRIGGYIR